jgi:hypothetical protein
MAEADDLERENMSPKRLLLAVPSATGAGAPKKASLLRNMNRDDDDGGGTFDSVRGWRGAVREAGASLEVSSESRSEKLRLFSNAGAARALCVGDPTTTMPPGQEWVDSSVAVHAVSLDAMPSASELDAPSPFDMLPAQSGCAPALPKPMPAPGDDDSAIVDETPILPKPISAASCALRAAVRV